MRSMRNALAFTALATLLTRGAHGSILPDTLLTNASQWALIQPGGTRLTLRPSPELSPQAIQMDYDLGPDAKYVVARFNIATNLPDHFEIRFRLLGEAPPNNLELKLTDDAGNTYARVWKNYRPSTNWHERIVDKRQLHFAWGPDRKAPLRQMTGIEFGIASGKGGQGYLVIDQLELNPLPAPPPPPPMRAHASSEKSADEAAACAVDGTRATQWRSLSLDQEWLAIDFEEPTALSGLDLHWVTHGDYDVLLSDDGSAWRTVYRQRDSEGGLDDLYFGPATARWVRIQGVQQATRDGYTLTEVEIKRIEDAPAVTASAAAESCDARFTMDGDMNTYWRTDETGPAWVKVDLQKRKAWGGLVIHWGDDYPRAYTVETSGNGLNWHTVYHAEEQGGGTHKIYLEETAERCLRIACRESATGRGYSIREIELKAPEETLDHTRFYRVAAENHPGCYPRWLSDEQAYWTIVGTAEDVSEGSICEDGTLEPHKRGFTIMPLLRVGGRLITRNEAEISQTLEKGSLPIPSVHWSWQGVRLDIQLFAHGGEQSKVYARYRLANAGANRVEGALFLVLQPMQVYPPWQGGTDGFSPIRSLAYSNGIVTLDSGTNIFLLTPPEKFAAKGGTFRLGAPVEGTVADDVARGALPDAVAAEDPDGFASGVAVYPFALDPGESREVYLAVPLHAEPPQLAPGMDPAEIKEGYDRMFRENVAFWESKVECVDVDIPDRVLVDMWKANVAYNLITKDGPGFQPGSRSYDKAWMRDGGSAAEALLKMGLTTEIREFIEWMGSYQFETGEVAPIIDNKHQDPLWEEKQGLQEFDSQGEFVHIVLQYYLFTRDRAFLEQMYPKVVKALEFLVVLREKSITPEYRDDPKKRIFYNILPASRSHEGYWLAHSYWDDFWALAGWKDGKAIAEILGHADQAGWMEQEYQKLKHGVYDTIALVMKQNKIDFIPGCAELGDLDPTSTAAAIVYCDELENMPQPQLKNTFDRFFRELSGRFEPGAEFVFTPYEMRTVLAYLFMGQKERALKLLHFMVSCRR
ncbi:MAG: discoidin domain-containing protein, partial [Kiritimatiellae bacterium]|nr:discoidin domain-containing protein [Kiritimatiellia bacterium]